MVAGIDTVNDKIYDMEIITASDYSVGAEITKGQWQSFLASLDGDTELATKRFQDAIKETIEVKMDSNETKDKLNVINVQFAFKNGQMFKMLE